jgi:hypothetical protein
MPVSITSVVCVNPATHACRVDGTASDASKVAAELHFVQGGLPGMTPLMVTPTGATAWTSNFNINPAATNNVVKAKLNDGTMPVPTDQQAVPPC